MVELQLTRSAEEHRAEIEGFKIEVEKSRKKHVKLVSFVPRFWSRGQSSPSDS